MSGTPDILVLAAAFLAAAAAGAVNAIAGGGTLISFPSLMALGLDSKTANMTSTVGLWPGSLGGAWGFRRDLARAGSEVRLFYLASFIGGGLGAWLLLITATKTFDFLVPWLILAATGLFIVQPVITRWPQKPGFSKKPGFWDWLLLLPLQFFIGVYGGYFGAGIGILMLAGLGFLGIDDIYQRNGIKNVAALFINGIAIVLFVAANMVDWPVAAIMAVGALLGAYLSTGLAKWLGPRLARVVVVVVGLTAAAWKMAELLR